ncbi:MAG: peptidoglycan DD-metalloendopeptidase family protein [Bacteroides sp.]|nr:peptidoglycan DD-metalloendopeptidase family protein [Bacteroides sp.]
MKRTLLSLLLLGGLTLAASAQSNRLIKQLQAKRGELQKGIAETEALLSQTRKDVTGQLSSLQALTGQIEERKRFITGLNNDVDFVSKELESLNRRLAELQQQLAEKKRNYASSVQFLHKNRSIEEKLLFILSAEKLEQTYRRLRYVQEYATYQRLQGLEVKQKQAEIKQKQAELQEVKTAKEELLKQREEEKHKLEQQEQEKRQLVAQLNKKQKNLQTEVARKKREASQLNNRIERLVAEEIERARKQAEEEARREAERARKAAKKTAETPSPRPGTEVRKEKPMDSFTMSKADRSLSKDFTANRGRLPMPITGAYLITGRYGEYGVEGLRNVRLDNKGIDIQGRPGAQARSIFQGKVAAVFQLNGLFNILVRHGNYISVYCNLSSTTVKVGDEVNTAQTLGTIFSDPADGGRTTLHFQLRREKEKLNPEPWLNR